MKFFGSLIFLKINQLLLSLNTPIDTLLEMLDPRVVHRWIGKERPMTFGLQEPQGPDPTLLLIFIWGQGNNEV